jgi:hypothetical protein
MSKKILIGLSVVLLLSMGGNLYLFSRMTEVNRLVVKNSNRLQYLEDNLGKTVSEVMNSEGSSNLQSLLEDVDWNVSELISEEEKTAMLHIEFKLKTMDSTSRVYASVELGDAPAELMEAHLLNDTTYTVDQLINVLEPVTVDLVIEKYGEKRLENLVKEDEIYRTYIADTSFNLLDFKSSYNEEKGVLTASYDAEVLFSFRKDLELVRSEVVVLKNGVAIDKQALEKSEGQYPDTIVYGKDFKDYKVEAKELDTIVFAAILKDKLGFTYRYDFADFRILDGEPVITTVSMPELTLN